MSDYQQKMTTRNNCLDAAGIGHDVESDLRKIIPAINEWSGRVASSATNQAIFNAMTNIPTGVMKRSEATALHAFLHGLVHVANSIMGWDINKAIELAADVLEDANAHEEAAAVRAMLK